MTSNKFQGHSPTSREAAFFSSNFSGMARERVFLQIVKQGGATDEEISEALRMNPSTQRPRRVELVEALLVEDSGHTRQTSSGMEAVVWIPTGRPYDGSVFAFKAKNTSKIRAGEKLVLQAARAYSESPNPVTASDLLSRCRDLL